jgi:hypothetical protein
MISARLCAFTSATPKHSGPSCGIRTRSPPAHVRLRLRWGDHYSRGVLQDLLVETQINDELLELSAFFVKPPRHANLLRSECPQFLPPSEKYLLRDHELKAVRYFLRAALRLPQRRIDLLRGVAVGPLPLSCALSDAYRQGLSYRHCMSPARSRFGVKTRSEVVSRNTTVPNNRHTYFPISDRGAMTHTSVRGSYFVYRKTMVPHQPPLGQTELHSR